jgi:hypothetical protein
MLMLPAPGDATLSAPPQAASVAHDAPVIRMSATRLMLAMSKSSRFRIS